MSWTWIIVIGILVIIAFAIVGIYNGLVRLRNQVKNAWAQIDVQLKRRYDLIPNLVETVKGYAKHERETFEMVTTARNLAQKASSAGAGERAKVEGELGSALGRLLAVAEAYPDLKANQNFLELQRELTNTEDRIQAALRFYNGNIRDNNNKVQVFPSNIVAGIFGFGLREFFELQNEEARQAPTVQF